MQIKERIIKRKNFLPTVTVLVILLSCWITILFFVPPEYFMMPLLFLILTFLIAFLSSALIFANTRRGLLFSSGLIVLMLLRYFEIGNSLNIVLIGGILLSIEYYLIRKNS